MNLGHPVAVWTLVLLCVGCDSGGSKPTTVSENIGEKLAIPKSDSDRKPSAWDQSLDVLTDAYDESGNDHELAGKWQIVSAEIAGRDVTTAGYYEFKDNHLQMVEGTAIHNRTFEMDPYANPKRFDSRQKLPQGTIVVRAIYRLDGDTLTISDAAPFHPHPDGFVQKTTKENDYSLCTLRRVADKD